MTPSLEISGGLRYTRDTKDLLRVLQHTKGTNPPPILNPDDTINSAAVYNVALWIGLIGPTRMSYDRAMPVVRLAARSLSEAFARLSKD